MDPKDIRKLCSLTDFPALVDYLRDELDWPIEVEDADEITFVYDPAELGIDPKHAVKIDSIKQVRPLVDNQPWGIFFIDFETKRLPVVVLRRILRALVPKTRQRDPARPVWCMTDLLFISAQGEAGHRSISFAHFRQREGRVAELRTFSWDSRETHFFYLKNLNLEALRWPKDETDAGAWHDQWGRAFTVEHRYVITTSRMLAREMALQARTVRELVGEVYDLEVGDGPLHRLYDSFKELLLHDLTPGAFADMVAQTVAYGLFSAAAQSDELPTLEHMVELIPKTNPFLKDLLSELTTEGSVDLEELGVGQLVELLWQTDFESILHDFGRQTGAGSEDPVVHFYELFLAEYDKEQKVQRGVFYTPDPVVSYIVRSVDCLLRSEFGLEDGLADTSINPETGEPLVQILDPAAGTGTFLAHVIDQVEQIVKAKPGVDWNAYVPEHLLPRLNGFELMMAPYAVAHMKLGLKLRQTGYDFRGDERLRVYLTNTLEEPVEAHETLALTGFLSKESNAAARIKRQTSINVVLGNPPYAGISANVGEWITGLLRGRSANSESLNSYYEVDGQPLAERKIWLQDDYVKFIRWAHWRIELTGSGIVAFITNHGYLDSPTFRGMRHSLMSSFDAIYVLDLHGSLIKRETSPDGGPDDNVFDIQPGVAILLAVKRPKQTAASLDACQVFHADLWGVRRRKYAELLRTDVGNTPSKTIQPRSPFYLFVPRDVVLRAEYMRGWKITEAMPVRYFQKDDHPVDLCGTETG
ncbi:N-6 DNA methylase, partial [Chloroflexota bacterium]